MTKNNEMQVMVLQKSSTPEQLKAYFEKVLELKQSGIDFPVNIDEVWPLVYNRKEEAVRTLKRDFIENVDYQALRRNAERGAASPIDYCLSLPCLEYLIVKKRREIFEVYRQVFHAYIEILNAKPFCGVPAIPIGLKVLFNYMDILRALGYSTRSGQASKRKKTYKDHFEKHFGRNFIDLWMCQFLFDNKPPVQLVLDFNTIAKNEGGVK